MSTPATSTGRGGATDEPRPAPSGLTGAAAANSVMGAANTGGDPPCWLNRVCAECGKFLEDQSAEKCPYCGADRDPEDIA